MQAGRGGWAAEVRGRSKIFPRPSAVSIPLPPPPLLPFILLRRTPPRPLFVLLLRQAAGSARGTVAARAAG
jgi:hypothetical protein